MTDFMNDIKKLEEALEEAEQANQKKNDFLNRMSHEIRTPLNAIIGLSYLSRECETMPVKVYENLGRIEQSAQFLLSFVNDILSLSELEAGKIALELETVENEVFFNSLREQMKERTEAKQIHLTFSVSDELEKYCVFDSKKLQKAILNVIDNAVKSTPAGGEIQFKTEILSQSEEKVTLLFVISDNGMGIEEELLPTVFEPFAHIYGESRTLYNGSGLELAIAKSIVDRMNGDICVQSRKGEGAVFTIALTVEKDCQKNFHKKENSGRISYDFSGRRALVVEDSDINIEIAKNILLHKQFEVDVALNGEEAVRAFENHEAGYYDVILMDIRMPVMDGLEATKRIRSMQERPDGSRIPIIAMTANAFEEDVKKSFAAGMNGHLSKPIDIKKMYALLDMLLSEQTQND